MRQKEREEVKRKGQVHVHVHELADTHVILHARHSKTKAESDLCSTRDTKRMHRQTPQPEHRIVVRARPWQRLLPLRTRQTRKRP